MGFEHSYYSYSRITLLIIKIENSVWTVTMTSSPPTASPASRSLQSPLPLLTLQSVLLLPPPTVLPEAVKIIS